MEEAILEIRAEAVVLQLARPFIGDKVIYLGIVFIFITWIHNYILYSVLPYNVCSLKIVVCNLNVPMCS